MKGKINVKFLLLVLFVFGIQTVEAQFSETYYERGFREVRKGNYAKAVEYFNYSISNRAYYQAYFYRGYAKFQMGDLLGSELDLTTCLIEIPTHKDALHYRAVVRSQLLNYEEAFDDFRKALKYDSTNGEIYLNRAVTQLTIEDYEAAIEDCNKAIKLSRNDQKSLIIKAIAETQLAYYEEAIINFNSVLSKDPTNTLALIHRAACYRQMGNYTEAESDLKFILLEDSLNADALLQFAFLENDKKNSKMALQYLNQVIELAPYNMVALFNRGITQAILGDYQASLVDYNQVIASNSSNVSAYFNRALLKQRMGKQKEALADFDKVIELLPNFTDAYLARAQLKKSMNDLDGAGKDIQIAENVRLQNKELMNKGISNKELKSIMKTLKLSNNQSKNSKDTSQLENQYVAIELKPYFHLIPTHFTPDLSNYHLQQEDHLDAELMGLIPADFEIDLTKTQAEIDSMTELGESAGLSDSYYVNRGILYTQKEYYNLAFQDFDTAISLDSRNMYAYFGRANVRLKLIELMEGFEEPKFLLGKGNSKAIKDSVIDETHSYSTIIEDYKKAIELDTSFSYARFNLSYAQIKNNQIQESLESLNQAIALRKDFGEAYFNRGLTYLYLKKDELACYDLSRAGELGIIQRYCSY